MNRFVVTKGEYTQTTVLADGSHTWTRGSGSIIAGTTGTQILYDAASQRRQAMYVSSGKTIQEGYQYAVDGLLTTATMSDITSNPTVPVGSASRSYDAVGNVLNYIERDASNAITRNYNYTYTQDSKVQTETSSSGGTSTYSYDSAGTLLSIVNPQPGGTTVTTTYSYEYWDTAKQSQIHIQASNQLAPGWKPGFSHFIYDVNGHLTQVNDYGNDGLSGTGDDRYLRYVLDAHGLILQRNELIGSQSSRTQYYYYLNGIGIGDAGGFGPSQTDYATVLASRPPNPSPPSDGNTIAFVKNNVTGETFGSAIQAYTAQPIGSADFDYNYMPINDRYPATTPGTYTLQQADLASSVEQTLNKVALTVWGDASLWYILADANGLTSGSILQIGQTLVIPNIVANIHNNASTFKVYNPGELIGDTTPTLPDPPPPPQPDRCETIVKIIIIVVITVVVTVATADALGPYMWGWAAAAIGAAAGNAAGQVAAKKLGLRDHFSSREVGTAALTAGLTNGIGDTGNIVTNALLRETISQQVRRARNEQEKFDWSALAAAPINGYIDSQTAGLSNATSTEGASLDGLGIDFLSGVAKGVVSQGAAILANRGGKIDWINIATNALGDAIGNAIAATFGVVQDARENRNEKWKQDHPEYTYATNPNGSLRVTGYANPPASAPLPGLGGAPLPNEPFSTEDNIPDHDAHRAPLIQNQERDEMGRPIVSDEARYFGGRANGVYFHETPDQISSSGTSGNYDATNPYQDLVDPTQPPAEARALPDRPTPWEQAKEIFGDSSVPLGPRLGRTAQALLMPNQYEAERTDVPYSWACVGIGALKELGNLGLTGLEMLGNAAFNAVAGLPAYLVGESLPYVPLPFRFEPQGAELRGAGLVEGAFLLSGVAGLERTAVERGAGIVGESVPLVLAPEVLAGMQAASLARAATPSLLITRENAATVLQDLLDVQVQKLAENPALARDVLFRGEYAAGQASESIARMQFGNAAHELTGGVIEDSPELRSVFEYASAPFKSTPDILGHGPLEGMRFEITTDTPRSIAEHQAKYGEDLIFIKYTRPRDFKVFP